MLTAELVSCDCSFTDKHALLQVALIGQGSYGKVYRAKQVGPMGDVAIKLLPRGDSVCASSTSPPPPFFPSVSPSLTL